MNVILERHFVCGTVHEDRLCDCGIAVQDEEHVLPIVSWLMILDESLM